MPESVKAPTESARGDAKAEPVREEVLAAARASAAQNRALLERLAKE